MFTAALINALTVPHKDHLQPGSLAFGLNAGDDDRVRELIELHKLSARTRGVHFGAQRSHNQAPFSALSSRRPRFPPARLSVTLCFGERAGNAAETHGRGVQTQSFISWRAACLS